MKEVGRVVAMKVMVGSKGHVWIQNKDFRIMISRDEAIQLGTLLIKASKDARLKAL